MTALVVAALDDVFHRICTDPRRWIQGTYAGLRTANGVIPFWMHSRAGHEANCWCLATAVTKAVTKLLPNATDEAWTEARSDVERELLTTLELAGGDRFPAVYQWNDSLRTSHADVVSLVAATYVRLLPEVA